MNLNLKNSFSWSFSRYNLFNFCERAYYFHYYGSWKGWDVYTSEQAKEAFRLKQLISKELWLNIALKKSLLNSIKSKHLSNIALSGILEHQFYKSLSSDINSIYSEEWKNDPKKICIDEIFYREKSIEETIKWIKNEAAGKIKILQKSRLLNILSNLPFPAFLNTGNPLSFTINNIKIWCSPDLMWNYHGKINILNLSNSSGWPFLAGLNMLYAEKSYNYMHNNIICQTVFFNNNSCFSVYGIRSPKEILNIITESSEEMQSRLTYQRKAYIENFSKTAKVKNCTFCRFKAICQKNPCTADDRQYLSSIL